MYGHHHHHPFYRPILRPRFPPWALRFPLHPYHRPFQPHLIPPQYFPFGHFRDAEQHHSGDVDESDGALPHHLAPGVDLVEDTDVGPGVADGREGREGRSDAAQLQPQAAAADSEAGAQPCPVPARRRQGHLQVRLRLHCGQFRAARRMDILGLFVHFLGIVLEQSGNIRNGL